MEKIELPRFAERIIGFTIPIDGKMYACDHDEVYELDLIAVQVRITGQNPHVFMEERKTLGISEESPIKAVGERRISYTFDELADSVLVDVNIDGQSSQIEFPIDSGDWFSGTISECGGFIVLAEPYNLWVYRI